ncbi:hypothetical protein [Vreelandella titanicae]|uniref:hypothetical protein n=1 Tax=Vreelandella titanicae TaxID=664683 RepID=UPI003D28422C
MLAFFKFYFSRRTRVATFSAILFFLSALTTGGVIYNRQHAQEERLLENVLWAGYQFDREVRELRLSLFETSAGKATVDDVLLRFEILFSRQSLFFGYTDLMVDGAPSPHQSDTTLRWLIDRLRS